MSDAANKLRILFVDDEPNVLQGLQRMLRPMRREWDMVFAGGGEEALKILETATFDIVVSDMRMPGMDGGQLLQRVMALYPQVVRMVLSGHSDAEMVLRSVGTVHQFLAKPCDAETLRCTIRRSFALRRLLHDSRLIDLVSRVQTIPSLPSLYVKLVNLLRSPDVGLREIGQVIAQDPGMTAKILQLVNSSFFGLRRVVASPEEAVSYLGIDTLKALVLSTQAFSQFDPVTLEGLSLETVWSHSMRVGSVAQQIARAETSDTDVVHDSFLAGMLHDVGKLVLAGGRPAVYASAMSAAAEERIPSWEVEARIVGASHAEVAAYLLGIWGLPDGIVEAVAFHHEPSKCLQRDFGVLTAVHAADVLVGRSEARDLASDEPSGQFNRVEDNRLDEEYLEEIGMLGRVEDWDGIRESCAADVPNLGAEQGIEEASR